MGGGSVCIRSVRKHIRLEVPWLTVVYQRINQRNEPVPVEGGVRVRGIRQFEKIVGLRGPVRHCRRRRRGHWKCGGGVLCSSTGPAGSLDARSVRSGMPLEGVSNGRQSVSSSPPRWRSAIKRGEPHRRLILTIWRMTCRILRNGRGAPWYGLVHDDASVPPL